MVMLLQKVDWLSARVFMLLACILLSFDSTIKSFQMPLVPRPLRLSLLRAMITSQASTVKKLPVTILSGFLGAGKTTLLQHILTSNLNGKRYAVIVNDMNEVNIDGSLIKPHISYQKEQLVEMSNGCICCTLREDLLKEVANIATSNKFDHLIIESTGIAEPQPIAETFTFDVSPSHDHSHDDHEDGHDDDGDQAEYSDVLPSSTGVSAVKNILLDIAEIDSMVTVVDAVNFLRDIKSAEDLAARQLQANADDTRTIADLLLSQVEFATVILINKCDLVTSEKLLEVKQMIRALNREAKIVETVRSQVNIAEVIGSRGFDFEKVSQSPAWIKAINEHATHGKTPETEEYGISSFVYRARKPFHPARLMNFINSAFQYIADDVESDTGDNSDDHDADDDAEDDGDMRLVDIGESKILRSKGFFWLASDPTRMMIWSQAGGLFEFTPSNEWWADTPADLWPEDEESIQNIKEDFEGDVGDRRQEVVFIGTAMDAKKVGIELDACLLTEQELMAGEDHWNTFDNPFPSY